jgi:hypothetical protein
MRIDPSDLRLATRAHEEAVAAATARARKTADDQMARAIEAAHAAGLTHRGLQARSTRFESRCATHARDLSRAVQRRGLRRCGDHLGRKQASITQRGCSAA